MKSSIIGKTFTLSKPVVDHVIVLHAVRSSVKNVTETVVFGWCTEIKGFIVHGGFPFSGKTTISVIGAQDMVINLDIFFRVACAVLKTMKIFLAVSNQRHIRVFVFVSSRVKLFPATCPGKMSDADRGLGIKDVEGKLWASFPLCAVFVWASFSVEVHDRLQVVIFHFFHILFFFIDHHLTQSHRDTGHSDC